MTYNYRIDSEVSKIYFKLTVALVFGILAAEHIEFYDLFLLYISFIIANKIICTFCKTGKRYLYTLFSAFFVGAVLMYAYSSYELNGLYPVEDKYAELSGYVCDIPEEHDGRYTYIIKTDGAKYRDKIYNVSEYVKISSDVKLSYSENISVRGFLKRVKPKMNSLSFDYARYYKSKRIFYTMTPIELATDNNTRKLFSPFHLVLLYKNSVINTIDKFLSGDTAAIVKAVTIGYKKDFSEEFSDVLYRTNTMRCLYPHYLHICLIIALIELIMFLFKKKTRDYVTCLIILIYAMFNFHSAVILKSSVIVAASYYIKQKRGFLHYPDVMSAVVGIILVFDPLLIYNSGFVYSTVFGWMNFMIREPLFSFTDFIGNHKLRKFVVSWIISCVGTAPLSAYMFNNMSALGPFINMIFFPFAAISALSYPLLLAELSLFGRSFAIRHIFTTVTYVMNKLPYIIDAVPLSHISIGKPSLFTVILIYSSVILIRRIYLYGFNKTEKIYLYSLLLIFVPVIFTCLDPAGDMNITFINVGQGDGILIELPKGENIITDGGGGEEFSDYDAGKKVFIPYLKSKGVFRIDLAVLSHFHKDHCLGTIAAMKELNVGTVAFPDVSPDNKYRLEIEKIAKEKNINILYLQKGDKITFPSGVEMKVLSRPDTNAENENDTSIVFSLTYNGFNALFTGDATAKTEKRILKDLYDVDLVKVPHHGSLTSSSEEFLNIIKPEYAVVSVGKDNVYSLPDDSIMKRYEDMGSTILKTSDLGDIKFTVSKSGKIKYDTYFDDR